MTSNAITRFNELAPVTKRGKRAASLNEAQIASAWLNAAMGTKSYRRILILFAHLNRLDGLLSKHVRPHAQDEWFLHQEEANKILGGYSFTPGIGHDSRRRPRYYAVPRGVDGPKVELSDSRFTVSVDEPTVAAALARLYASRELFHVHLCENCKEKWHARIRKMDRFCSRGCQIECYSTSPEHRERNRLAQQRFREQLRRNGRPASKYRRPAVPGR